MVSNAQHSEVANLEPESKNPPQDFGCSRATQPDRTKSLSVFLLSGPRFAFIFANII